MNNINRIKVALLEKKKTSKWLAEQLEKDPATVSKWCTNSAKPCITTFVQIANLLNVDIRNLFNSTDE